MRKNVSSGIFEQLSKDKTNQTTSIEIMNDLLKKSD